MRRSKLAALGFLVVSVGCSPKSDAPANAPDNAAAEVDVAAVRQKIEAGNAALIAAMEKGDSITAASFYDDSAMIMAPGEDAAVGSAGILREFGAFAAFNITNMKLVGRDIIASGDLATETGHYEWTLTPKKGGGKPVTDVGKYVVVWRKQADGSYKLLRDIWNNDAPVTAKQE